MKAILKKSQAKEPFSFSFVDTDGKTVIRSENYVARKNAINGIASVKKNCVEAKRYEHKTSKNGKLYFNLKAANGQVVATSSMFDSQETVDAIIAKIMQELPEAAVEETEI